MKEKIQQTVTKRYVLWLLVLVIVVCCCCCCCSSIVRCSVLVLCNQSRQQQDDQKLLQLLNLNVTNDATTTTTTTTARYINSNGCFSWNQRWWWIGRHQENDWNDTANDLPRKYNNNNTNKNNESNNHHIKISNNYGVQQQKQERQEPYDTTYRHRKLISTAILWETYENDRIQKNINNNHNNNQYFVRFNDSVTNVTEKMNTLFLLYGSSLSNQSTTGIINTTTTTIVENNNNNNNNNNIVMDQTKQPFIALPPCGEIQYVYDIVTKGFTIMNCFDHDYLNQLFHDPDIIRVIPDTLIEGNTITQDVTDLWHLDRIDQKDRPLDGTYKYDYVGTDVHIYVLDTGIMYTHEEFNPNMNRSYCGYNVFELSKIEPCIDNHSHGTYNTALVGGTQYGVAKNATLIGIRVLNRNNQGSLFGLLSGLEYVAKTIKNELQNQQSNETTQRRRHVVNMSLSTKKFGLRCFLDTSFFDGCLKTYHNLIQDLDAAVKVLYDMGVVVVVAAGNNSRNACRFFPASSKYVITVGATNSLNTRALYSNFGRCVDIFAPGSNIKSANIVTNTSSMMASGTSGAAPLVAGTVALYLQRDPTMTPDEVRKAIQNDAFGNIRLRGLTSPNKLLNTFALIETV